MTSEIAIVGAGFSGSLLALQILRAGSDVRVHLIEKGESFARGLAYGAADPGHLLNVRAANMSAFPDMPDHFAEWLRLAAAAEGTPAFVSRQTFGSYLQALLGSIVQTEHGAGRLVVVGDEVVGVDLDGPRPCLRLAMGRALEADHVVLATGNLPPHDLACFANADPARYLGNPWQPNAFDHWMPNDDVLLVGTGLTAVDMALRLRARGHVGSIAALSRRGLRPRRHTDGAPTSGILALPLRPSLSSLLRIIRREAEGRSWHEVVDSVRPAVQRLWGDADVGERRRFLRHLRPWWDVHRHRIAPAVADALDELVEAGRLSFSAGQIADARFGADGVAVEWRPRGQASTRTLHVQRVVNCTGPAGDLTRVEAPLFKDLLERGQARPDACELGLDVDADCRVLDAHGKAHERLLAVGPLSRGAFWEITAVPDIRVQAASLARQLTVERVVPAL